MTRGFEACVQPLIFSPSRAGSLSFFCRVYLHYVTGGGILVFCGGQIKGLERKRSRVASLDVWLDGVCVFSFVYVYIRRSVVFLYVCLLIHFGLFLLIGVCVFV